MRWVRGMEAAMKQTGELTSVRASSQSTATEVGRLFLTRAVMVMPILL